MIDCSKTENFLIEKHRMCFSFACKDCGLSLNNNSRDLGCRDFCCKYPQEAITIVQKWSNENLQNPQKTFYDDYKEKYPNALLERDGTPRVCPYILGYVTDTECPMGADGFKIGCIKCWNRPYIEEE